MRYYLAIDIGASSGRHILGSIQNGQLILEEIYRFENKQILQNGHTCWDIEYIWKQILEGLKACARMNKIPHSIGIDTWAVDYVLLDERDDVLGDAVAYRDGRTEGIQAVVNRKISAENLYRKTGIQYQPFNTIYQLVALQKEHPEQLQSAQWLCMIPDYLHFRLTGVKKIEYTNATSTNLVNAEGKSWDRDIIEAVGLPQRIFHVLSYAGECVGRLLPAVQHEVGFDATVILPATHDTGSAFLSVPAMDENAVYLSSGTWSLLGIESMTPIATEESRLQNFTNEGGAWGRYRYLKNIMGLWMVQSIRRELNGVSYVQGKNQPGEAPKKQWSFSDLICAAKDAEGFSSVVDVNRECFLAPSSMMEAVRNECARTGQPIPATVGEVMQCVYSSLAVCYRDAIKTLERLSGRTFTRIHIVGGGCQDEYLNARTAQETGLSVLAGPIEGTAIGNLIVQMIAAGEWKGLQAARDAVRKSFAIKEILP